MKLQSASAAPDVANAVLLGATEDEIAKAAIDFTPLVKSADQRYTFGPMYVPDTLDAHNEWTEPEVLQKAIWEFAERADWQTLRKQHGPTPIGRIVEMVAWPKAETWEMSVPGQGDVTKSVELPAGTVYTGSIWEPEAWPLVKAGKITGYSMGGTAVRMRDVPAGGLTRLGA